MELILEKGRPDKEAGRLEKEIRVYDLLDRIGLEYQRGDHAPAMTMEACRDIDRVLEATVCKNLFLCNRQKTQFYLLMIPGDKVFHTRDLSAQIGSAFPSSPAAPGGNRRNVHRSRWGAPGWPRCCRA